MGGALDLAVCFGGWLTGREVGVRLGVAVDTGGEGVGCGRASQVANPITSMTARSIPHTAATTQVDPASN